MKTILCILFLIGLPISILSSTPEAPKPPATMTIFEDGSWITTDLDELIDAGCIPLSICR